MVFPPSDPQFLVALGGASCVAAAVLAAVIAGFVVRARARRRAPDPAGLARALRSIGYQANGTRWARRIEGVATTFEDSRDGWRWTAALPRYQEARLRIEERGDEWPPAPREGAFLAGDPELDHRFRFLSARSGPCLAVLAADGVGEALLALPWVELELAGDEVVLRDPERVGLSRRTGGQHVDPTVPAALPHVLRLHADVAALMVALARHRPSGR